MVVYLSRGTVSLFFHLKMFALENERIFSCRFLLHNAGYDK